MPTPDSVWCKSGVKTLVWFVEKLRNTLVYLQTMSYQLISSAFRYIDAPLSSYNFASLVITRFLRCHRTHNIS